MRVDFDNLPKECPACGAETCSTEIVAGRGLVEISFDCGSRVDFSKVESEGSRLEGGCKK